MEVTVHLHKGASTVGVQVIWRDITLNLLREREELVERFLQRLGLSCGKHAVAAGDRKRAKKEKKKVAPGESAVTAQPQGMGINVCLLKADGERLPVDMPVAMALQQASHMEIEGDRLPVSINPPSVKKLEVFGRPLAGCPLLASLRCEFCDPEKFRLSWLRQVAAGGNNAGESVGEGRIFVVPEDAVGQTFMLRAESSTAEASSARACTRTTAVERVPHGWPERRVADFGERQGAGIRVVCYNILAPPYAASQTAKRDMYPYCPEHALDFAYRQPLLGRELRRLSGDLVFLQEVQYITFRKFLVPLFGEEYHLRVTLKASQVSEGCAMMIRKSAFKVLEERDHIFRHVFRGSAACRPLLREVAAKWPGFVEGILPHMTTIFQLSAVEHVATGRKVVLANTHLFYHPMARHVRLLQMICLLQLVQDMRERHCGKSSDGKADPEQLPAVILCGDLNCTPDRGAVELLLKGEVPSDHSDWEHALEFSWGREAEEAEAGCEGIQHQNSCNSFSLPSMEADPDDEVVPLPKEEWQPGLGMALRNPLGPLDNAYASDLMPFTHYVRDFNATLDYILTTGMGLHSVRTLPGPSEEEVQQHVGLPSVLHASDHLSIAADLEFADGG
mmetsp:Transcript_21320/g.47114  ORF Transcript_21320/g.47114 Transcript_21320/m.47114 type:complete len:619 (+) Transcript_21320:81-1937(+)